MMDRRTLDILQEEIVMPKSVQEKAEEAFAKIRLQAAEAAGTCGDAKTAAGGEAGSFRKAERYGKMTGNSYEPEVYREVSGSVYGTEVHQEAVGSVYGTEVHQEAVGSVYGTEVYQEASGNIYGTEEEVSGNVYGTEVYQEVSGSVQEAGRFRAAAQKRSTRGRTKYRRFWPMAAAAVLSVGILGAGAAAAYIQWGKSLEEGLRTTAQQRQLMEENQMVTFVGQSVTQGDVTVTAQQSIVDQNFAYLSFRVEGYQVEDGVQPGFSSVGISVGDGEEYFGGYCHGFYDGLVMGEDGGAAFADGTPLTEDSLVSYTLEDGSLEYQVTMYSVEAGFFIGKPIQVTLEDLGTYTGKAEDVVVDVQGVWNFEWTMEGSQDIRTLRMDAPLGESGARVVQAELSPISIKVTYDFPRQEETELAIDADGNEREVTVYAEPPYFTGVRLKDGTMYTRMTGMGGSGYSDEEDDNTWERVTELGRVIDVDQVESLLFIKNYPEDKGILTEENLYIVPVE